MSPTSRLCAAPIFCQIPLTDVCCLELWREEGVNFQCVINYHVPMSKRKPTSSHPGIDWFFYKSRRTESQVDEGEKTAGNCDRQTPFSCVRKQENALTGLSFSKIFWGSMPPILPRASGPAGFCYVAAGHIVYSNATGDTVNETAA